MEHHEDSRVPQLPPSRSRNEIEFPTSNSNVWKQTYRKRSWTQIKRVEWTFRHRYLPFGEWWANLAKHLHELTMRTN